MYPEIVRYQFILIGIIAGTGIGLLIVVCSPINGLPQRIERGAAELTSFVPITQFYSLPDPESRQICQIPPPGVRR